MNSEKKIDLKSGVHNNFPMDCSIGSLSQRSESLKSDVAFLKDHIKAVRAMSIVSSINITEKSK